MLAKKILSAAFLIAVSFLNAQNFTVKGKVQDSQKIPQEYATALLLDPESFDEINSGITNSKGEFELEAVPGNYLLVIETFMGITIERAIQVTKNEDLGIFELKTEDVVALEGINITGDEQVYRMELDKKVYELSKDPMAKGASLSEALENVPSVEVDGEGNVSLRGNENVRILIDGKPSSLIGVSNVADALKSLPADIVERIEIVTNPSARFEAEGSAGIINIILKKGKLKGTNGSVNVSGGIPATAGVSANLNYRTEKWNLFTNLGYRYAERENRRSTYTTRFGSDGTPRYEDMTGKGKRINNGFNILLGSEFYLDEKSTFTLSGAFRNGDNKSKSDITYLDFDSNKNLLASSSRIQDETEDDYGIDGNLSFKHEFDTKGHELNVDARVNYSKETENGVFREIGDFVDSREKSISEEEKRNRVIISADYVYPFAEKGRFEFGLRGELSGTLTDFKVDSLVGNSWIPNDNYANRTDNKQNVYAAYAQYGRAFGQFSFFAGLRLENSDITVESIYNNSTVKKNYTDFFPSLFLNYEFLNQDQLQLSYSRRIRRPRGWDLIPYMSYSDNRNMRVGNPALDPQYTDSYELSYVTKMGKFMLTPNVYYSRTTDNIQRYQSINEMGVLISRPINVGTDERYGGDLTFTYRPFRWWNLMGNVNLYGYTTKGKYSESSTNSNGEIITRTTNFNGDGFSWFGRISNTFTLPAKINLQISGMYRAGNKTAQSERKPGYGVDLSLSKDLFNDNATLTASVRDVLNSRQFKMSSFGEDFYMDSKFRWNVRSVNISFTYRFNQSKRDQRRNQRDQNANDSMEMEGEGMM